MYRKHPFFGSVMRLAIPVALQSMLQSSFGMVDQIMIGQLGSICIAGVGLAGKFASIFSVLIAAIGAVAGIMISQYLGQENRWEVRRSFAVNLTLGLGFAVLFSLPCALCPRTLMRLYSTDAPTVEAAAEYLSIISATFLPMAGATMLSTLFRCMEKPGLPLCASVLSALLNTGLNYILIFGAWGIEPMGAKGAAIATAVSQCINFLLMLGMLPQCGGILRKMPEQSRGAFGWCQYVSMLLPVLVCEALWSLGENVYAAIYGHMGTDASAAMTLINPVQGLVTGALCGLSQAAGVIVGKLLGSRENERAYAAAKRLLLYGACGAVLLSAVVLLISPYYVRIYRVEASVMQMTRGILLSYALVSPFKVLNMILGGGILRSGGKTKYVMCIDAMGTWAIGVPAGLLAAFVLKLSIPYVYFLLSLEECVRFVVSVAVFRRKRWMCSLETKEN